MSSITIKKREPIINQFRVMYDKYILRNYICYHCLGKIPIEKHYGYVGCLSCESKLHIDCHIDICNIFNRNYSKCDKCDSVGLQTYAAGSFN